MNNLHRVQNIFIGNGDALPANDAASTVPTLGQIGIYGTDWKALNPSGADTMITQPSIYLVESKQTADGVAYLKKSMKIDGKSVISYKATSYKPAQREVWAIGHNRKTAVGTITVAASTDYKYSIRFKNDKFNFSARPETLSVSFTSAAGATQLNIATQIAAGINSSSFTSEVVAVVVGDGTGIYGLTGATDYGVEITAKDVAQFVTTTYTPNLVYFSVHVDDSTGFGTGTTCTQIQGFTYGSGTYAQVYNLENKDFGYEGVTNRRQWPIPALDYSSTSTLVLSAAIGVNVSATISEDTVTFASDVSAIIRPGEKVEINSVNYEIKYFISTTVAVLTSTVTGTFGAGDVCKVRLKYDTVVIEFNDTVSGPTGTLSVANKSVIIAVPAIDTGDAYNGLSAGGQDVVDILNGWLATAPGVFATISI